MKKLPKEKRDKIVMIGLMTLMSLAAMWFLVIRTQQGVIKKRASAISDAKKDVEFAQRLVAQSDRIETEMEAVDKRLEEIEAAMVSGDMYSWVIKTMNRFLIGQNVEIPTFTPPAVGGVGTFPEAQFPYKAATFAISGTSYYHDFGRFLAQFENQFPCARIQNVQLEPAGIPAAKPGNSEKIAFKLEIVALIKPTTTL